MDIFEIKVAEDWTAEQDLDEFEARFGARNNVQQHALERIEGAYQEQVAVLVKALRYYLDQTTSPLRVPVAALSIPELCGFILKCVSEKGREPEYAERFIEHLNAIQHFDRQRATVMARHWANPDHAWLLELADVSDTISTSSYEFDEAMCCEHDDYKSVIDTSPLE